MEDVEVVDSPDARRYEARLDGELAGVLEYELRDGWIVLVHTEVQPAFEGRGIGSRLAKTALDDARQRRLAVTPKCPFVLDYVKRHREYRDLIVGSRGPRSHGLEWTPASQLPAGDLERIEQALGWPPQLVRPATSARGAS